ncbi:MAG: hypothetical protein J5367_03625 [Lachnospiraceae bacterium]|nr:hypothetical protein [Lachnospiraceae bacterium]
MSDINSVSSVGLRRYSNNLVIAGRGYILFGFWSVVKVFMMMTMQQELMQKILSSVGSSELSKEAAIIITVITVSIMGLVVLCIHLYIGMAAIRYGKGTKRRRGFVVWGVIISAIMIIDIPLYFTDNSVQTYSSTVASIIVDMTEVFIFSDMLYSSHMLKRLRKEESGETVDAG